jgi:hypothetical protein
VAWMPSSLVRSTRIRTSLRIVTAPGPSPPR